MDIWEKPKTSSPDEKIGWRLDHPHFQDVYKTTYAKGVISDVYKTQDNPIRCKSLVKVKVMNQSGEMEEYDEWIPLFYRPKDGYWDDNDSEADEFNQDEGYFEKAWMSFRCDDEVVVQLEPDEAGEPVPKRVVGFIDNYPRRGETIGRYVNTSYPIAHNYSYLTNPRDFSDYQFGIGPDDFDLQLVKESEILTESTYDIEPDAWSIPGTPEYYPYGQTETGPEYYVEDGELMSYFKIWVYNLTIDHVDCDTFEKTQTLERFGGKKYVVREFAILIGPILFIYHLMGVDYEGIYRERLRLNWSGCKWVSPDGHAPPYVKILEGPPDNMETLPPLPIKTENSYIITRAKLTAGIYSQELIDNIKNAERRSVAEAVGMPESSNWHNIYDGMYNQSVFVDYGIFDNHVLNAVNFYTVPHTKEELIDAGLLNEDGTLPDETGG